MFKTFILFLVLENIRFDEYCPDKKYLLSMFICQHQSKFKIRQIMANPSELSNIIFMSVAHSHLNILCTAANQQIEVPVKGEQTRSTVLDANLVQ